MKMFSSRNSYPLHIFFIEVKIKERSDDMLTIINNHTNPYYNLALEEYVFKYLNQTDDFILLYQNEPSIIIGRNQNTIEEINSFYVKKNNISVVRRISGGGTVYHDLGNLNYSFITSNEKSSVHNFKKFTTPIIHALNELGIPALFSSRSNITVEGKKISGNAQSYYKNKMLHHGTILFDSDLEMVTKVLDVKLDKVESKSIKSVRSQVANILPYLKKVITMSELKDQLLKFILQSGDITNYIYTLTDIDKEKINQLMNDKYLTWEWNYGESPEFQIQKTRHCQSGIIDIFLNVINGTIKKCIIDSDFLTKNDTTEIENLLLNNFFEEMIIKNLLSEKYASQILVDDIINCLFF